MSVIGSNILAGASGQGGGYNLTNSVRFRSSASAYLNRTFGTPTSSTVWTWSGWVKIGTLSANRSLFSAFNGAGTAASITLNSSNQLQLESGGGTVATSTAVFRDPSAFYHIVCSVNGSNTTIYVNNESRLTYSGGTLTAFNTNTVVHNIGRRLSSSPDYYFDGYLTEVNFIDGQAITPSSFGETSSTTGVWQPKRYAGTYGTNGFYLPFTDNSALTSGSNAGLGKDFSGNGNYWTTNNISITSGATYDSMTDVPTLTSETESNFPTLNPLWYTSSGAGTLSNANLTFTQGSSGQYGETFSTIAFPPIGTAGKYYFEFVFTNGLLSDVNQGGGVYNSTSLSDYAIVQPKSSSTVFNRSGSTTSSGTGYSFGDVLQVAIDTGSGKIWYGKNNTWYSGNPATDTSPTYSNLTSGASYVAGFSSYSYSVTGQVNFGQRPFAYTPPTGFVALNTYNLPTPTIGATASSQANKYFDATLYTGNGTFLTVTNAGGFQPDLVWVKDRSNAYAHCWGDSVRGVSKIIASNRTDAEYTDAGKGVYAFNSNGFSVAEPSGYGATNQNGDAFVAWQWKANGTGITNTAGSITSTVSANTTSGFSVVTYTGNGSNPATVGHGLGVAPKWIIIKNRSTTQNWIGYHSVLGSDKFIEGLNTTNAAQTSTALWNNTAPTSSVFTIGNADVNTSGRNYVAYCFSEVAGFSKFGSYTGNGSTDGTFVYTGFRPKYVLVKCSSASEAWIIQDLVRDGGVNASNNWLYANLSNADGSGTNRIDMLSNGFKLRNSATGGNASGATFIYAAFAEVPTKYALGV